MSLRPLLEWFTRPDGPAGTVHLAPADADGWQRATIPLENLPHTIATLLQLGADVQVLAPEQLVTHLANTIQAMASLYPP